MAKSQPLVADDDPGFVRFWAVCGHRTSKLDARKAWAELAPSPELVDRMVEALRWQVPMWAAQGYGQPYPATYLRHQRWTDEPPTAAFVSAKTARTLTSGAAFVAGGQE